MSFFKFAAHDATISSIIDAYPSIGYKAVATKLAESGIHVKPSTMQKYMQPLSELGVTYLSMSDLIAREATIASIIDADPSIGGVGGYEICRLWHTREAENDGELHETVECHYKKKSISLQKLFLKVAI